MSAERLRILVVDDERIVCDRLSEEFQTLGFEVETCMESTDALARLAERPFDFVITDLKMRGPGGIEIARFVKENCPATRVIVVTGFATVETAKQALREGAVDFVPKPFKMGQVTSIVQRLVAERTRPAAPESDSR
jgi:DNA-binding NtrC family response regulator